METPDNARVKPTQAGWQAAKRAVAERNDEARKAGKKQRMADERKAAAHRNSNPDLFR